MPDNPQPTNSIETLVRSLKRAGVPFEIDPNGNVKGTPEVLEFLRSREALKSDTPTVVSKEELTGGGPPPDETDEERDGYVFRRHESLDRVKELLDEGDLEIGPSTLEASSPKHCNYELFIGPIWQLYGEPCLVKRNKTAREGVAVQFLNGAFSLNGRALGFGFHDFPAPFVTDTRPQIDKMEDAGEFPFLVNVVCEDPDHSKTVPMSAPNQALAEQAARDLHKQHFPDANILHVETHDQ